MTHVLLLSGFSVAVGIVLGTIMRDDMREALRLGAWIAGGMIVAALLIAWAMYLFGP